MGEGSVQGTSQRRHKGHRIDSFSVDAGLEVHVAVVEAPVDPRVVMTCPTDTVSPTVTSSVLLWA